MGRRLAFLIGNQAFGEASGLIALSGPHNDVAALEAVLRDPARGGFTVTTFLDQPRGIVMPALDEALSGCAQGDLLLLFYAGHGKLDPGGRLCLATAETRASALYSTSIPAAELRNLISNSACDQVVLLLDCCYSGAAGREFTRGGVDDQLAQMREAQGLHVLTASTSYQTARELDAGTSGIIMGRFTRAIADGIASGAADLDHDGTVSLSDLRRHLQQAVRGQTPQYWAQDAAGDPMIARAAPVELPAQKRARRLGAWYAEGRIGDDDYSELVAAAAGTGDPRLAALVQRLLDNPRTTPEGLVGAWEGAVRPPPPDPPPAAHRFAAPLPHQPPQQTPEPGTAAPPWWRFRKRDYLFLFVPAVTLAGLASAGGAPSDTVGLIVTFVMVICAAVILAVKLIRRGSVMARAKLAGAKPPRSV